jgi:uncharacterized protein (DUF2062 family)
MRQFAKEKLKHWLRVLLHTQDSPERTALAFAVGVFIAFLPPVFWLHTLFALLIAFLCRLNRLAVLAGTYTNTPVTMIPLIGVEIWVGKILLREHGPLRLPRHPPTSFEGWRQAFIQLKPFVFPLVIGSIVLGLVGAGIAYLVALRVIRIVRRRRAHAEAEEREAEKAAERAAPGLLGPAGAPLGSAGPVRPAVDTPENPT